MRRPAPGPIEVFAAAVIRDGRVLVARRTRPADIAGLFEFPGGKQESGESPEACLAREFREELGYGIEVEARLGSALRESDASGRPALRLTAYSARPSCPSGEPSLVDGTHDLLHWVTPTELRALSSEGQLAPLDVPLVAGVLELLP